MPETKSTLAAQDHAGAGSAGRAPAAGEPSHGGGLSTAGASSAQPVSPEMMAATVEPGSLAAKVIDALRTCFDPEIPVNIYELGLVYGIDVDHDKIRIRMTLTSPMCPVAGSLPGEVAAKVRAIPGVADASVDLVWDPPWDPSRMSESAKLELGMF